MVVCICIPPICLLKKEYMLNKKTTIIIFIVIMILNAIFRLFNKPLNTSDIILAILYFIVAIYGYLVLIKNEK